MSIHYTHPHGQQTKFRDLIHKDTEEQFILPFDKEEK